jgi:hypothetical protein
VDGHVHITNRVYWENIDPWERQPFGFDYARASASGVNVIIENVAPYRYANFNYTPRQTLRLIETPVVASPTSLAAVSGTGMPDSTLQALAAKAE